MYSQEAVESCTAEGSALIDQAAIEARVSIYLAYEYSRLSFAPATTCETRRKTSAIRGQKFHTDDLNLLALKWHN